MAISINEPEALPESSGDDIRQLVRLRRPRLNALLLSYPAWAAGCAGRNTELYLPLSVPDLCLMCASHRFSARLRCFRWSIACARIRRSAPQRPISSDEICARIRRSAPQRPISSDEISSGPSRSQAGFKGVTRLKRALSEARSMELPARRLSVAKAAAKSRRGRSVNNRPSRARYLGSRPLWYLCRQLRLCLCLLHWSSQARQLCLLRSPFSGA